MTFVEELIAAGYNVEVASGSTEVEQAALAEARAVATPERIETDVQAIADQAALDATALAVQRGIQAAKIPAAVSEAVSRITALALEQITVARSDQVAFHERALVIAKAMPTTYVVNGPGFENLYVDVDDATGEPTAESAGVGASLRDPELTRERFEWDARFPDHPDSPELIEHVQRLRGCGHKVKPTISEGGAGFTIEITEDGKAATVIADDLERLRAKVEEVEAASTLPKGEG